MNGIAKGSASFIFYVIQIKSRPESVGAPVNTFLFRFSLYCSPFRSPSSPWCLQIPLPQHFSSMSLFFYLQPAYSGPSFINLFLQYSQSALPPLRPICGEAPGRDSNRGQVAGTLTTRPPHLHTISLYYSDSLISIPPQHSHFFWILTPLHLTHFFRPLQPFSPRLAFIRSSLSPNLFNQAHPNSSSFSLVFWSLFPTPLSHILTVYPNLFWPSHNLFVLPSFPNNQDSSHYSRITPYTPPLSLTHGLWFCLWTLFSSVADTGASTCRAKCCEYRTGILQQG